MNYIILNTNYKDMIYSTKNELQRGPIKLKNQKKDGDC